LLAIFCFSQYGKFISYAYCVAQAEVKGVACDCASQLAGNFKNSTDHAAQLTQKDKYEEPYITAEFISMNLDLIHITNFFDDKFFFLLKGFEHPLFHPPTVS
jgi:hypothetical protein